MKASPPLIPHRLADIDYAKRTATCSVCGHVRIKKRRRTNHGCALNFRCINKHRIRHAPPYQGHKKKGCERCDFVAVHHCQLDVHHKDGSRRNSASENLMTLCANCHRLALVGLL